MTAASFTVLALLQAVLLGEPCPTFKRPLMIENRSSYYLRVTIDGVPFSKDVDIIYPGYWLERCVPEKSKIVAVTAFENSYFFTQLAVGAVEFKLAEAKDFLITDQSFDRKISFWGKENKSHQIYAAFMILMVLFFLVSLFVLGKRLLPHKKRLPSSSP